MIQILPIFLTTERSILALGKVSSILGETHLYLASLIEIHARPTATDLMSRKSFLNVFVAYEPEGLAQLSSLLRNKDVEHQTKLLEEFSHAHLRPVVMEVGEEEAPGDPI